MAYDETLAARIRKAVVRKKGFGEKAMFGGAAFLLDGNMCVGVHKDSMIVRLDPDATAAALKEKHTRVFDLTGRPMKGWILVEPAGLATDAALRRWIDVAIRFAAALQKKSGRRS